MSLFPFAMQDMESVSSVLKLVDKAGGYVFGEGEARNIQLMQSAMTADVNYVQYPLLCVTYAVSVICLHRLLSGTTWVFFGRKKSSD